MSIEERTAQMISTIKRIQGGIIVKRKQIVSDEDLRIYPVREYFSRKLDAYIQLPEGYSFCSNCLENKPVFMFRKGRGHARGDLHAWCNNCNYVSHQKYYKENKDELIHKAKAANNKRRSILNELTEHYTKEEWLHLLESSGYRCQHCNSPYELCADHVYPISKGGNNTIDNIQVLCRSCNSRKSNKTDRMSIRYTTDPSGQIKMF